jgi:hypothetical protein
VPGGGRWMAISVVRTSRCAMWEAFVVLESLCSYPDLGAAYPGLLQFHLSVVRGVVARTFVDGGLHP